MSEFRKIYVDAHCYWFFRMFASQRLIERSKTFKQHECKLCSRRRWNQRALKGCVINWGAKHSSHKSLSKWRFLVKSRWRKRERSESQSAICHLTWKIGSEISGTCFRLISLSSLLPYASSYLTPRIWISQSSPKILIFHLSHLFIMRLVNNESRTRKLPGHE